MIAPQIMREARQDQKEMVRGKAKGRREPRRESTPTLLISMSLMITVERDLKQRYLIGKLSQADVLTVSWIIYLFIYYTFLFYALEYLKA